MKHVTIDYGIDLGTTNSAICRMDAGNPVIIRSDSGQETMPSCISFKKGGQTRVGDAAYQDLGHDKLRALKKGKAQASSSCIEFKRFMGSDMTFANDWADHRLTPEELSARVIEALCSFVTDDKVEATVITVPAKFTVNQKDATLTAARMAGISQVELLQEPIAASMAYGLRAEEKNGIWMVFDLGGGTLDVALVHVSDGVMQVFDTEGDNYLGGKNLDEAIVAKILLPELAKRYVLPLGDKEYIVLLVEALKVVAEKLKNRLSYVDEDVVYLEAGDWGEDEDGEEIELELTVTRQQVEEVMRPILQKAVDTCLTLMMRNSLTYEQLTHLILIGGPTRIPLLRQMLADQVTKNVETGIDPMTAVAQGAAIYASTIPVTVTSDDDDADTVQLDVKFEATTVATRLFLPVKMRTYRPGLQVQLIRQSDGLASQPVAVGEKGALAQIDLLANQPNTLRIAATLDGVEVKCFPPQITIVQGTKAGSAILPYNIGIEVINPKKERCVFTAFTGLEKNRPLPATGHVYGLRTASALQAGCESDKLRIAIYQGDDSAEGKTAALFEHVADVVVTGDDITSYVPQGSLLNITIDVDRSEMMTVTVEFTATQQTIVKHLDTSQRIATQSAEYLKQQIELAYQTLYRLGEQLDDSSEVDVLSGKLKDIGDTLDAGGQHKQIEQHLKEVLRQIEDFSDQSEWHIQERKLRRLIQKLNAVAMSRHDPGIDYMLNSYNRQVDILLKSQNLVHARNLELEIDDYLYKLYQDEIYRKFLRSVDQHFSYYSWSDPVMARKLADEGRKILAKDPNASLDKTRNVAESLAALRTDTKSSQRGPVFPRDLPTM